jgi:hypothetical protein
VFAVGKATPTPGKKRFLISSAFAIRGSPDLGKASFLHGLRGNLDRFWQR